MGSAPEIGGFSKDGYNQFAFGISGAVPLPGDPTPQSRPALRSGYPSVSG